MNSAVGTMSSSINQGLWEMNTGIVEHSVSVLGRPSMLYSTARLRSVGIITSCKNNPEKKLKKVICRGTSKDATKRHETNQLTEFEHFAW